MSKTDSGNPKKLMNELDDLVHFLADGPEAQQEMRLPQDQLASGESASDLDKVPVLTAPVDQEEAVEAGLNISPEFRAELGADMDQLIDDLVDHILPKLETELRRRLKTKISESNS